MTQIKAPYPFNQDKFTLYRNGVWDDVDTDVYVNEYMDFCCLHPHVLVNYKNYVPRREKLGLGDDTYDADLVSMNYRLKKISLHIRKAKTLLEVGGGDGAFASIVKEHHGHIRIGIIDEDKRTLSDRTKICDFKLDDIRTAVSQGLTFDIVCLFHVFEHILNPSEFLQSVKKVMTSKSILLIEVPSLFDPLLTLYKSQAYKDFYFYSDHPFVYSHTSIERIMKANEFETQEIISHQRYGLDNHLQWVASGKRSGNSQNNTASSELDKQYKLYLESKGYSDSVIWVGRIH